MVSKPQIAIAFGDPWIGSTRFRGVHLEELRFAAVYVSPSASGAAEQMCSGAKLAAKTTL